MAKERFDVFLSYNSADRIAVEDIARRLADRSLNVWFDRWEIAPGHAFQDAIEYGLTSSRAVAVFIGPTGLGPWALGTGGIPFVSIKTG